MQKQRFEELKALEQAKTARKGISHLGRLHHGTMFLASIYGSGAIGGV
jgi:hypothetical protein